MDLRDFEITITGKYSATPNKERMFSIDCDTGTNDIELFVILHEVLCRHRNWLNEVSSDVALDNILKKYKDYHYSVIKKPVREFKIEIFGKYSEVPNSGRVIKYQQGGLSDADFFILMSECVINLRNKLSETMSRKELSDLAVKYKVYNLGMRAEEEPFVTRGGAFT